MRNTRNLVFMMGFSSYGSPFAGIGLKLTKGIQTLKEVFYRVSVSFIKFWFSLKLTKTDINLCCVLTRGNLIISVILSGGYVYMRQLCIIKKEF